MKTTVDLVQGENKYDEQFGYIAAGDCGYFFDWKPTLEETIESVNQDTETVSHDEQPDFGYTDAKRILREAIEEYFDEDGKLTRTPHHKIVEVEVA